MKLKGFTILELLIAMALTGLVLLLAGQVLFWFQKGQALQQDRYSRSNKVLWFDAQLQQDCKATFQFRYADNILELLDQEGEILVRYEFKENETIRHSPQEETFPLKIQLQALQSSSRNVSLSLPDYDISLSYQSLLSSSIRESTQN